MEISELTGYLRNKRRTPILLAVLFAILILLLIRDCAVMRKESPKFQALMTCVKCHVSEMRESHSVAKERCGKCGGQMALLYHCDACGYEFPYSPKDRETLAEMPGGYVKNRQMERRCPNCGSSLTHEAFKPSKEQ